MMANAVEFAHDQVIIMAGASTNDVIAPLCAGMLGLKHGAGAG